VSVLKCHFPRCSDRSRLPETLKPNRASTAASCWPVLSSRQRNFGHIGHASKSSRGCLRPGNLTDSPDLHDDLPLGSPFVEISKRILRLIELKYLVDHRSDAPRIEKFTYLRELATVWMHEEE
jgi:hypothetical protein